MAEEETTPQEEEEAAVGEQEEITDDQPTASEELAVYQEKNTDLDTDTFDGVTDPVPGAVTESTPELSKRAAKAEGAAPLAVGGEWLQLVATDNVEDLGLQPGTRVRVVDMGPVEMDLETVVDPYHPVFTYPEDGPIVVETRDAKRQTVTVNREDLEPVVPGSNKG